MEVLKKELRSLLIAAKEGLTPAQLEREYLAMIGKPLPACALGFRSTLELVAEMPDVVRVCPYGEGAFILKAIADETTKGIAKLVARQKGTRARKRAAAKANAASPSRNPHNFCQRLRAPVLPAPVITAAPAMVMPPLEPICETESFHLMPGEQPEPVETKAIGLGDGLKQEYKQGGFVALPFTREGRKKEGRPQDLEQFLLEKLLLTPEIPPDAVQDRNLCGLPPLERRCMVGVSVGFITSPSQFYIHVFSRKAPDDLQDMMCEMRYLYSHKLVSDRYVMPKSSVRPGQLCCVMVRNWWYRVIIHRVISSREVQVFCADYGNLAIVQKSWLRFLKSCYLKLPAQAIPCSLARVKPVEGTWSSAATLLFKELCSSKLLVGLVDEYVCGVLHLFLCDTSTKEDVYFHYVLSDRGHANICGENIPSQGFQELNPLALYTQPSGQQECSETAT